MTHTISVTGHRQLDHSFENVSLVFTGLIRALKASRVRTGMAIGFDQLVAYNCLSEGIPYEAIVPFEGQEALWPAAVQEGYKELLALASSKTVVCSGGYAAWKMHARNGVLVLNANILVAYLNPEQKSGGTRECVKLAEAAKTKIINIYPWVTAFALLSTQEEKSLAIENWLSPLLSDPAE